ncbi:MAG: GNAT family N-acetyltransferase [Pseudomonadota bacterium]
MILTTDRLTLRQPDARDVEPMLDFFASDRARFYFGPLSRAEGWKRFAIYAGQWALRGYGFFAVTRSDTGQTVGLAGPYHPEGFAEPEMSWLLTDAAYEGHGYATEACRAVLRHLYADKGWASVVSYIDPENAGSIAVATRLGAVQDPDAHIPLPGCLAYRHRPEALA